MTPIAETAMLAQGWRRFLMLLVAGAIGGLSVPPLYILPALFVTMPLMVWALDGAERRRGWRRLFGPAFSIGFAYGLGYFLVAFHWLGAAFFVAGGTAMLVLMPFAILALALPGFWIGTLVMVFPSIWWGWSPEVKFTPFSQDPLKNLAQMAIPALILGKAFSAVTMRLTRTMMLEVMRQDYIRTALAKGLAPRTTIIRHALRNALIPVVTLVGLQAPVLFGGAVIMEQIFVIPGMGLLLLEAVSQRDYPIITGVFLIVGVAVVFINLLVDLSYGLLDPKVRYR